MTAQGIEVESVGYVTDSLKLTASYTFTDAKTDETGGKARNKLV